MFDPVASDGPGGGHHESPSGAWAQLALPADAPEFAAAWLALQCEAVPQARAAVLVMGPPDTGPFTPAAFWPSGAGVSALLAEAAELALEERRPAVQQGAQSSALALPVLVDGRLHALVALETGPLAEAAGQRLLAQLQWGLQGIEAAILREQAAADQAARERMMDTLDLVASTLTEQGFEAAAGTLATDLARRLDADRVSIGFREGAAARVVAISHSAQVARRMDLAQAIAAAMDEAIDQQAPLQLPAPPRQLLVTRDHAALARAHGNDCLLTIPFVAAADGADGAAIGEAPQLGAFTFERPAARPFSPGEVALCQAVTAMCSRILHEKRLNGRPLALRLRDGARAQLARLAGPGHVGRKLAAALLAGGALFFTFATGAHVVGGNAALEGVIRRVMVAPFDGYVETAPRRAGDTVAGGAVLATLDQRDLQLEYLRWSSQNEQYASQYQEAVAKSDRVQANISLAQANQATAQMQLLAEQLARASIKAPFDGIVVSGDLTQSLGSAVKRGQALFEVAPLNVYRVLLEVDESDIGGVRAGQMGELMLAALPGQVLPLRVTHVTPVAVSRDGRTFFRVEAALGVTPETRRSLRPGLEGVGRITLGERKLAWLWTHRLFDWLRLAAWSWV